MKEGCCDTCSTFENNNKSQNGKKDPKDNETTNKSEHRRLKRKVYNKFSSKKRFQLFKNLNQFCQF